MKFRDEIVNVGSGHYVATVAPPPLFYFLLMMMKPDFRTPYYYTLGHWSCEDGKLYDFLRVLVSQKKSFLFRIFNLFKKKIIRDHISYRLFPWKIKKDIALHYNTSPDFMKYILGQKLVYTCAFFPESEMDLKLAQDTKIRTVASRLGINKTDEVLDLGCGYGVIGIHAAKCIDPTRVYMLDNDPTAVALARANAASNSVADVHTSLSSGFHDFREAGFTLILCNPPYHSDFSVAKHFIHKGFNRLTVGGKFWMVTQREPWYRNKLRAIFGDVKVHRDAPYSIFEATKHSPRYANAGRQP